MGDEQTGVRNPVRVELEALKKDLTNHVEDLKKKLHKASKDVGERKSWAGKNAKAWHAEIEGKRRHLRTLIDNLLPAVEARIREEPEKISPQAAKHRHMGI
ncbi:hypothetical protein AB0436_13540 [Streptomyces sp. NPDC051322]|uniref:hypothetical protein n=1 Tax=Streptomyces sp. NPDC051322 TaxID=3154645 RepID=UPI00344BF96A